MGGVAVVRLNVSMEVRRNVGRVASERMPSKACFGRDIELAPHVRGSETS